LYLDENLCNCKEILDVLDTARIKYRRHLDRYETSTKDPVFLPDVGKHGWTMLTCDDDIRRRGLEKQAVLQHKVRMFVFTSTRLSGLKMARILKDALPAMRRFVQRNPPPFIASITEGGLIYKKFDGAGPRKLQEKSSL